jgi:putative SOS response-associated peptidase YedK
MCGRLVVVVPDLSELVAPYAVAQNSAGAWQPRFNLAPTQTAPVITNEAVRRLDLLRFGFVSAWPGGPRNGRHLINARVETVAKLRSFRRALALRRCIVPVSGYYEWQTLAGRKRPHFIHTHDGTLLSLAGVWERWQAHDGQTLEGFVVLTRPAAGFLRDIHDRMPLVVPAQQIEHWLDPQERDAESLAPVLQALPALDLWTTHEVSPLVNTASNDSPECLASYTAPAPAPDRQLDLFASPDAPPRVESDRSGG